MAKYRGVQERPTIKPPVFGDNGVEGKSQPLLIIELQDETSVPKVFYEGEEITGKVRVLFDWVTEGAETLTGGTKYNIEYHEMGHEDIVKKGIGLCRGKYALD